MCSEYYSVIVSLTVRVVSQFSFIYRVVGIITL
jgi:hypothetical protein